MNKLDILRIKIKQFVNKEFKKKPLSTKLLTLIFSSSILAILTDWIINDLNRGSTEFFQQHLLFWCGILSSYWVLTNKSYKALCIPLIYFFLSLDDFYFFHDRFANNLFPFIYEKLFSYHFSLILPLDRIGEIIYWLLIFLFLIFISLPGIISNSTFNRNFIKSNFIILFILSFFELFIDFLYVFIDFNSPFLNWFFIGSLIIV